VLSLLPPLIAEGRKIIILTSRRDHIADLLEQITQLGIATCGPYVGGMKLDARNETKAKQILVATYKMAEEGFDCQELDTLIMATPKKTKKSITQSCGRIMRKSKNVRTKIPLIIDVVDIFSSFGRWFKQRRQYYVSQNYRLAEYEVHCPDDTLIRTDTATGPQPQPRIVCTQEPKWIPGKAPEPVLDDEPDEQEPSATEVKPDLAAEWDFD
jgi:superfamily II DNA or RNA helicase